MKLALSIVVLGLLTGTPKKSAPERWTEPDTPVRFELVPLTERCTNLLEEHGVYVAADGGGYGLDATNSVDGCTVRLRDVYRDDGSESLVMSDLEQLDCGATSHEGFRCVCLAKADVPRLQFEWAICALNVERIHTVRMALLMLTQSGYSCSNEVMKHVAEELDQYDATVKTQSEVIKSSRLTAGQRAQSHAQIRQALQTNFVDYAQRFDGGFAELRRMIKECPQQPVLKRLDELSKRGFVPVSVK
ncbi:MAG: hypothetical protein QM723_17200 [Myxococcaceae bacterium]